MKKPLHWAAASGEQGRGFFREEEVYRQKILFFEEGEIDLAAILFFLTAFLGISWLPRFGVGCILRIFPVQVHCCRHHTSTEQQGYFTVWSMNDNEYCTVKCTLPLKRSEK